MPSFVLGGFACALPVSMTSSPSHHACTSLPPHRPLRLPPLPPVLLASPRSALPAFILLWNDLLAGDFRFAHVRTRTYAESIAFYNGEGQEYQLSDNSLQALISNMVSSSLAKPNTTSLPSP